MDGGAALSDLWMRHFEFAILNFPGLVENYRSEAEGDDKERALVVAGGAN